MPEITKTGYKLPSYDDCYWRVKGKSANPLEKFIVAHTPGGPAEKKFREQLTELLNYAKLL